MVSCVHLTSLVHIVIHAVVPYASKPTHHAHLSMLLLDVLKARKEDNQLLLPFLNCSDGFCLLGLPFPSNSRFRLGI